MIDTLATSILPSIEHFHLPAYWQDIVALDHALAQLYRRLCAALKLQMKRPLVRAEIRFRFRTFLVYAISLYKMKEKERDRKRKKKRY